MKISHVLYSGLGGHSSVVFSLIEADRKKAYDHSLIFYGIENVPEAYTKKCKELNINYEVIIKRKGLDIKSYKKFYAALKTVKPGVILLHSPSLILPAWVYRFKSKVKLISTEHQSNHLKTKSEWLWSVLLLPASDKVIYLTPLYKQQIQQNLSILFNTKKACIIGNGININLFRPINNAPINNQIINIGMLSRLTKIKDHTTLFRAFKIVLQTLSDKKLILNIAGEGETKASLELYASELGIKQHIIFHGMIDDESANLFLNRMNIYVHATLGESMSTALIQAMACQRPVVASDVDGVNNMITHNETGLLVPAENETAMAKALLLLLENNALAKKIAQNAQQLAVEKYSNVTMFEKYKNVFDPK